MSLHPPPLCTSGKGNEGQVPPTTMILHFPPLPPDALLVIAVSGGADSLALLHWLAHHAAQRAWRLHAATLDHGLRGPAGAADAQFVAEQCAAWGVPCTRGSVDVYALAESEPMGMEAAARHARYRFLAGVAASAGAQHVLTAHHADDQAETVLMHILRGSGLHGLAGMRPLSPLPTDPTRWLIRPLLYSTRAEIESYCAEHRLTPRHDASNDDPTTLRNRLRLDILPQLDSLIPGVARRLGQLAETAAVEDDFLEAALDQALLTLKPAVSPAAWRLNRAAFLALPAALQRRLLLRALAALMPQHPALNHSSPITHYPSPSFPLLLTAIALAERGQHGAIAQLGGGRQLRLAYDHILIEREPDNPFAAIPADLDIPLHPPVTLDFGPWRFSLHLGNQPSAVSDQESAISQHPAPSTQTSTFTLRTRRPGDRFAPPALGGRTRKLSNWFIDRKVPQAWRDHLPLLIIDDHLAAVFDGQRWHGAFGISLSACTLELTLAP